MKRDSKHHTREEVRTLWEQDLERAFTQTKKKDSEVLMEILSLVVFNRFNSNIAIIYKVINNIDTFVKLIDELSDQTLKFPNSNDFRKALTLALSYYYKEVKGMNWLQIQKELPYEKDVGLHNGKKIASLNRDIKRQLDEILASRDNPKTILE